MEDEGKAEEERVFIVLIAFITFIVSCFGHRIRCFHNFDPSFSKQCLLALDEILFFTEL